MVASWDELSPYTASRNLHETVPKYSTNRLEISLSAFLVTIARVWNSLPQDVISAPSLPTFRTRLKGSTFLPFLPLTAYTVSANLLGHYNCTFYLLT